MARLENFAVVGCSIAPLLDMIILAKAADPEAPLSRENALARQCVRP